MKKEDTRKRLLEATLKLISEKGYLGAATREIAHDAGVTEVTLFRHFTSKEHLFEEVLRAYSFLPQLRELLPGLWDLSYPDAITVIATRFLLTLKERKSRVKIMYSEINLYPEKIRVVYNKFIDEIIETLASYFKSMQEKGVLRRMSAEMAARAFLGVFFSYFKAEEIMRGKNISRKKMEKDVEIFVDIFAHGTVRRRC
jgi:AcrR family transcriptional regulator